MKKKILDKTVICVIIALLFAGCSRFAYYDSKTSQEPTTSETSLNAEIAKADILRIGIEENREGEQVFTIDIEDYIQRYNSFFEETMVVTFFRPCLNGNAIAVTLGSIRTMK